MFDRETFTVYNLTSIPRSSSIIIVQIFRPAESSTYSSLRESFLASERFHRNVSNRCNSRGFRSVSHKHTVLRVPATTIFFFSSHTFSIRVDTTIISKQNTIILLQNNSAATVRIPTSARACIVILFIVYTLCYCRCVRCVPPVFSRGIINIEKGILIKTLSLSVCLSCSRLRRICAIVSVVRIMSRRRARLYETLRNTTYALFFWSLYTRPFAFFYTHNTLYLPYCVVCFSGFFFLSFNRVLNDVCGHVYCSRRGTRDRIKNRYNV